MLRMALLVAKRANNAWRGVARAASLLSLGVGIARRRPIALLLSGLGIPHGRVLLNSRGRERILIDGVTQ
eukprot:42278-Chlamydomonas_euryale.AAC.1